MPSDYDLAVHVDDTQFATLIEAITGKPYEAEVEIKGKDKVTTVANKIKTRLESNPITQPIVQKIQQFGQKIKEKITPDTSDADNGTAQVQSNLDKVNKSSATAQIRVNTDNAMAGIARVRSSMQQLSGVVATPRINVITGNAMSIVSQIKDSINQLRDKTVTLTTKKVTQTSPALGTAHSLGSASLSSAYARGSQDWTIGRDEPALVNEIGQESRVRDGVWELIPGGPHIEDLKKDDIIN